MSDSLRVGRFDVTPILDAEGSFATVKEVFPALDGRSERDDDSGDDVVTEEDTS